MPVSTVIIRAILQSAGHQGLSLGSALGATRAELADMQNAAEMVPDWRVERIISRLVSANRERQGLGFVVGHVVDVGSIHLLGAACTTRRTARDALAALRRIGGEMLGMVPFDVIDDRPDARVVLSGRRSGRCGRFFTEFYLSFITNVLRSYASLLPWVALRAEIRHALPLQDAELPWRFELSCERDLDCIVFSKYLLDTPLPGADSSVAHRVEVLMEELIHRPRARSPWQERVRLALTSYPQLAHVDPELLAGNFGMSARSLRRRLKSEGMVLSDLVDEARIASAISELGTRSISETARRMGYSEPSAFHRAFKRCTGSTPKEYLRARRASGAKPDDTSGTPPLLMP